MSVHAKKLHTDDMVKLEIFVHRANEPILREIIKKVEAEDHGFTVDEVFPEYIGKENQIALRAYRNRQNLTQKQLSELTSIPQHQISEMENGKRTIGKERAKRLANALHCDYRRFL